MLQAAQPGMKASSALMYRQHATHQAQHLPLVEEPEISTSTSTSTRQVVMQFS